MPDIYLYDDAPILRNTLQIKDEKTLELIEAEQSRANMMLLYEQGLHISEYEHLEKILLDAICDEPDKYDEVPSANEYRSTSQEKYRKYQKEKYTPEPHYRNIHKIHKSFQGSFGTGHEGIHIRNKTHRLL